jgi:hypothetical protein
MAFVGALQRRRCGVNFHAPAPGVVGEQLLNSGGEI